VARETFVPPAHPNTASVLDRLAYRDDAPPRTSNDFLDWAADHDPHLGGPIQLSRYLAELRDQRPDLLDAFPQIPGLDVARYRTWAREHGKSEVPIEANFVPDPLPSPARRYQQPGVNLAGFLNAELGVGEIARRLAVALRAAEVPTALITFAGTQNRATVEFSGDCEARYDTNLICVNADSWGRFAQIVGPEFFAGRHTVAVWFWETSIFPSMFDSAFIGVDEIWVASSYVAEIVARAAPHHIPVRVCPIPIIVPDGADDGVPHLGDLDPGRSYFLTSFDHNSITERKNPGGAIAAFRNAFPDQAGPQLVVKSINGNRHPDSSAAMAEMVAGRADIVIHDGYLTPRENAALIAGAVGLISLHRVEGFGLNIADAMALGVPVVATAYGGNLEFVDDDCWLVPASEVAVGEGHFPYLPTARWGDPDLSVAADHLQVIAADPTAARARAARSRERVLRQFTTAGCGAFIRNHLAAARATRETVPPPSAQVRVVGRAAGAFKIARKLAALKNPVER
jgi:glycosyltransferase involved in cell wall biosynthesis